MHILVTITQCRRVVLPHLFIKYTMPMMAREFNKVSVHIVQHYSIPKSVNIMETSTLPEERELLVSEWTRKGYYEGAIVTRHSESFLAYPSIPSRRVAAEFAVKLKPDLHLWLEDDAFLFDENCGQWAARLNNCLAGTFSKNNLGYINSAYFVSKKELDLRLLQAFSGSVKWDINAPIRVIAGGTETLLTESPRVEPVITKLSGGMVTTLGTDTAARFNRNKVSRQRDLWSLLSRVCPEELSLTSLDFDWHQDVLDCEFGS